METPSLDQLPKKQQQLIESARDLFCLHGIRRVTIEEICKNAQVSKMTYYKYFSNKLDIARAVIDVMFSEGLQHYFAMLSEPSPFAEKVEKILTLTLAQVHAVGATLMDELMDGESPLHGYFLAKQKKTRELSLDFFRTAQKDGHIHSDIRMPVLLFMLDQLSDLLNHPDFIQIMPNIEDRASELAALFFHGFSRSPSQG